MSSLSRADRFFYLVLTCAATTAALGLAAVLTAEPDTALTGVHAWDLTPPRARYTPPSASAPARPVALKKFLSGSRQFRPDVSPILQPSGDLLPVPGHSAFSLSAALKRSEIFSQVQGDDAFIRLGQPWPGQWLWNNRERGQTLTDYGREAINRKGPQRRHLHLLRFRGLNRDQRAVMPHVREFTATFFNTPVKVLPVEALPRRFWSRKRKQVDADRLVRWLVGKVPDDSLGLFAFTGLDLYAKNFGFLFGEALLHERAGIHSLHRFAGSRRALLERAIKISAHEVGHMFGMEHCVFYRCIMNGATSLREFDRLPLHLCPVCLAKLAHNLGFDAHQRYQDLQQLYRRLGFMKEAEFVAERAREVVDMELVARGEE